MAIKNYVFLKVVQGVSLEHCVTLMSKIRRPCTVCTAWILDVISMSKLGEISSTLSYKIKRDIFAALWVPGF